MPDEKVNTACSDAHGERRRIAIVAILFLTAFFCAVAFFTPGRWAQVSHDDLTRSIVEDGTFRIDRFITEPEKCINTGDWSFYDGHYYSNKAPGTSFLAALVYLPVYHIEKGIFHKSTSDLETFNAWWFNLFVSVLPFAFGCVLFFLTLRKLGCSLFRAGIFSEISALCTPLWSYSTSNWSHPFAAVALLGAFYALLCADDAQTVSKRSKNLALSGFACGCAFLADYGCGAAIPVFVIAACIQFRRKVLPFFLGALGPALVFCWYHYVCFGSPFVIASFYNNPIFIDAEKTGGIFGHVSTFIMLKLLIGSERGIFWSAPVLLAAIPGFMVYWNRGGRFRKLSVFLVVWILSGIVANSAFNGWNGGATVCARYLIFTLPAFCILAAGCPLTRPYQAFLFTAAVALSWFNMLVINAVTPLYSDGYNPLYLNDYRYFFHDYEKYCATFSPGSFFGGGWFTDSCLMLLVALVPPVILFRNHLSSKLYACVSAIHFPRLDREQRLTLLLLIAGTIVTLIYPLDIIWVQDEPRLLQNALYASLDGTWCRHGLPGDFGAYGPFPLWVYQLLLMFSLHLPTVAVLKTVLFLAVCLYLIYKISRLSGIPAWIPFALFFASPWLRHYSRCLWDNIFVLPIALGFLLAFLKFLRTQRAVHLIFAAGLCVLAISVHSMAAPLAGGVLLFFLLFKRDILRSRFFLCASCALPAAFFAGFIMLSRFLEKSSEVGLGSSDGGVWKRVAALFQFATHPTTIDFWKHYKLNGLPGAAWCSGVCFVFGWIVFGILLVAMIVAIRDAYKEAAVEVSSGTDLVRIAICVLVVHVVFFAILGIQINPQYHQVATMLYILPPAYGLCSIMRKYKIMNIFLSLIVAFSLLISLVLANVLNRNAGTNDFYSFGPTFAYQWRTVSVINETLSTGATIDLQYNPNVMPYDAFPLSLDVMREFEDISNPKGYPDFPESDPIPIRIAPPVPAQILSVQ